MLGSLAGQLLQGFAATCTAHTFLGIPPWYKYLIAAGRMQVNQATGLCELNGTVLKSGQLGGDITLIAMGVLDILLRLSAYVAVGFIIYGSIQYITSDGQPDKTKEAQSTIINALVGLVIAFIATAAVSFIGRAISR
jgi:hypothetical protein